MNEIAQPEFNSLARRRLGALQSSGFRVVGLAIGRDERVSMGTLTALGRIDWHPSNDGVQVSEFDLSVIPTDLLRAELASRGD